MLVVRVEDLPCTIPGITIVLLFKTMPGTHLPCTLCKPICLAYLSIKWGQMHFGGHSFQGKQEVELNFIVGGHPKIHFITDSGIWPLRGEGVYY